MKSTLEKEFEYYLENQDTLVEQYNGKVLVIKDLKVLGSFDSISEAIEEMEKKGHKIGTFLVQKCSPGDEDYTAIFHSRVA